MNNIARLRVPVLSVVALLAAVQIAGAQNSNEQLVAGAAAQAGKLQGFLPGPVKGLIERLPWSEGERGPRDGYGCGESACPGLFFPIYALASWDFDDPALIRKVEELNKQGDALLERASENAEASAEATSKREAALAELGAKFEVEVEKMTAKLSNPNLSDREREQAAAQFQAVLDRFEQDQKKIMAPTAGSSKDFDKLETDMKELKSRARLLEFTLDGNATPEWCSGELSGPVPSGSLKGRPLYRYAATTAYAPTERVCLAVYLGPAGFKNPPVPADNKLLTDFKTILVKVKIASSPETVKADEAVARQLLDKIDYDSLARLLKP